MEDKAKVARATALLAANAYTLIKAMSVLEAHADIPRLATFVALIPAAGIVLAYGILENEKRAFWLELLSAICVLVIFAGWILWRYQMVR